MVGSKKWWQICLLPDPVCLAELPCLRRRILSRGFFESFSIGVLACRICWRGGPQHRIHTGIVSFSVWVGN